MTDEQETTVCSSCVLLDDNQEYPEATWCNVAEKYTGDVNLLDPNPPDWCPLRKGPVLVTLKLRS